MYQKILAQRNKCSALALVQLELLEPLHCEINAKYTLAYMFTPAWKPYFFNPNVAVLCRSNMYATNQGVNHVSC